MDGSRSWCHFRQRFQRPPLQRRYRQALIFKLAVSPQHIVSMRDALPLYASGRCPHLSWLGKNLHSHGPEVNTLGLRLAGYILSFLSRCMLGLC